MESFDNFYSTTFVDRKINKPNTKIRAWSLTEKMQKFVKHLIDRLISNDMRYILY